MSLLAAERTRLTATPAFRWCTCLALLVPVSVAALYASASGDFLSLTVAATQDGYRFGLVLVSTMAALAITTEHRYGTMRTTYQAIPRRTVALLATTAFTAATAAVTGEAAAFLSWAVAHLIAPATDLALDTLADWRAVAGVGVVSLLTAVIATATAALIRHSAATVTLLLAWQLLAENFVAAIPAVGPALVRWLPFSAAHVFLFGGAGPDSAGAGAVGPWSALLHVAVVAVALLGLAVVAVEGRDA